METVIREFNKGEVIFKEGDFEMCMYDLEQGKVGIYANYGTKDEKLLTELDAASTDTFGEMGLVDAQPRSATAVALEDVRLQVINTKTFADYLDQKPEVVLRTMQNMSKRVRALTNDYLEACRAVSEALDSEKSGKEKSGWFRTKADKFIKDYDNAMKQAAKSGNTGIFYPSSFFW